MQYLTRRTYENHQDRGFLRRRGESPTVPEVVVSLRWEVVRTGLVLAARDRRALVDFRALVPLEYFDLQPYLEREADGLRRALEKSR